MCLRPKKKSLFLLRTLEGKRTGGQWLMKLLRQVEEESWLHAGEKAMGATGCRKRPWSPEMERKQMGTDVTGLLEHWLSLM